MNDTVTAASIEAVSQERHRLDSLLAPRSIALVGASHRANSSGNDMVRMARAGGFAGPIYPVNPKYESVEGLTCYPSLADLPGPVDHVVLGIANHRLEDALTDVAAHGAKAATIFGSGYLENDNSPALPTRLAAIAREAGIEICGGNGMGFSNLEIGLHVAGFPFPGDTKPGPVTWIAQSGSVYGALAYNERRLRFNICVSSGAEYVTTTADYLEWALMRRSTGVVGLFLESVRDPERFAAALALARDRNIPVVALKAGRTPASATMARTHTGAVAGDDAAYRALFDHYGVSRVDSLDELTATLLLLSQPKRAHEGGLASIHDSGGECELLMDMAADIGVKVAEIAANTRDVLVAHLEPGLAPVNPLDAWGTGRNAPEIFERCLAALMADDDTGAGLVVSDLRDGSYHHENLVNVTKAVSERTDKPLAFATNYAWLRHDQLAERLTKAGIALIDGTEEALCAVKHLFDYRDFRARAEEATELPSAPAQVTEKWLCRLSDGTPPDAAESPALLSDFGIRTVPCHIVQSAEEAVRASETLGYPVVLKTAEAEIAHKTDVGGVKLNLAGEAAVRGVYHALCEEIGPRVQVSPMITGAVEIGLGAVNDPQFGPFVMIAAGGELIELLDDNAVALAPIDRATALRLIGGLQVKKLLDGARGRPAADIEALADALARLSVLAHALRDVIDQLDVNPVMATPQGCFAVDALVVPRPKP